MDQDEEDDALLLEDDDAGVFTGPGFDAFDVGAVVAARASIHRAWPPVPSMR